MGDWKTFTDKIKKLLKSKNLSAAKEELAIGLAKNPNQVNLLTIATDVYRASGDREKSLEYAELLTTHHPDNLNGYRRAAEDLAALTRFKEAHNKIQAGLEKLPNDPHLKGMLINIKRDEIIEQNHQGLMQSRTQTANNLIKNFSFAAKICAEHEFNPKEHTVIGSGNIFCEDVSTLKKLKFKINFGKSKGGRVYLGKGVVGSFTANIKGDNSIIWIGENAKPRQVQFRSFQDYDFIAIGNSTSTTAQCIFISGNGAGVAKPSIIIGDDCMLSYGITMRNSDGHPIISASTNAQVNEPQNSITIGPHTWIGEGVAILKNVNIGACSIVALGSVVTKSMPACSICGGNPAKLLKVRDDQVWARNMTSQAIASANKYLNSCRNDSDQSADTSSESN